MSEELDDRQRALSDCISQLQPKQREILQLRYEAGGQRGFIAERVGRSPDAVYNVLSGFARP